MYSMRHTILAGILILFSVTVLFGQTAPYGEDQPDAPAAAPPATPTPTPVQPSQLDEWRDTLRFGINTAVAELLPTLTRERREELSAEVIDLFNTSNNRAVLQGAAEYLRTLELPDGHDRGLELVREYFDRPSELITTVLRYLRETGAQTDEETRSILVEISRIPPPARAVAAVRLYASGDIDTDDLIGLYREPGIPEDVQGQILVEMGTRGDTRAFDFVADIIGEDEEATTVLQRFAIDTLGRLGDERAIPIILRQLGSSDAMTRAYAVNALTQFDTDETNRAIVASLRDQFWRVRVAALQTVAEREMVDALPAVVFMMRRDPERPVRLQAIRTIGQLDREEGWDPLLERMADPRGNVEERSAMIDIAIRNNAAYTLEKVQEIVQEEWDKENSRILDAIGRTVSLTEDDSVSPVVEQLLNHPNYIIQTYGARAAGRNRLTRYAELLRNLRTDGGHRIIREAAENALAQMGLD